MRLIRLYKRSGWWTWPGKVGLSALLLFYLPSAPAQFLDGETLTAQLLSPNTSTVVSEATTVVGPGVEFQLFIFTPSPTLLAEIDITDTGATSFFRLGATIPSDPFNGIRVFDTFGVVTAIRNVTLSSVTNIPGLNQSRITFDEDNVFVNMAGLTVTPTSTFELDIEPVPLPAALPLFVSALAGLGVMARRRKRLVA